MAELDPIVLWSDIKHDVASLLDDRRTESSGDENVEALRQFRRAIIVLSQSAHSFPAPSGVIRPLRHKLLVLERQEPRRTRQLQQVFSMVLAPADNLRLLERAELFEVLNSIRPQDLLLGVSVDSENDTLTLYRGDLSEIVIPFAWFDSPEPVVKPDFSSPFVEDFGQTLFLGEYESSTDSILYEFDSDYRRHIRKHRLQADESFGGSLRRLRLQRGVRRNDFTDISEKEIARIERGEVKKPQHKTLESLARTLGVPADSLDSF